MRLEAGGLARVASLLTDVVAWGLHWDLGFRSFAGYRHALVPLLLEPAAT